MDSRIPRSRFGARGSVRGGVRRETIPDLHVVDPLVNGVGGAAVEIRHHDAIDGGVVDPDIGPEPIGDRLTVDGHPDAAITAAAAMPENLVLEPLSYRNRDSRVDHFPEFLIRQTPVGYVVALDFPEQIATVDPGVPFDLGAHAVIAGGLPLEDKAPVPGSRSQGAHAHELPHVRLVLEPVADVEVARFAGGMELERILGRSSSLGVRSATPALSDGAVEGLGRVSVMPRHGLDLIDHVIAHGQSRHRRIDEKLEAAAAAPYVGRPGEPGDAVNADEDLPAARSKTVVQCAESHGTLKPRAEQELRGGGRPNGRGNRTDRVQIEVLLVGDDLQHVRSGGKGDALFADPLEGAPAAGVGHEDRSGHVDAVDLDVEGAGCEHAADPEPDVVLAGGRHVDGVGEPLPGLEIVHGVAAAEGVGGQDDVHVLVETVLASRVAWNVVVVGDAFAAEIEILRLESSGNRYGSSRIRRLYRPGGGTHDTALGRRISRSTVCCDGVTVRRCRRESRIGIAYPGNIGDLNAVSINVISAHAHIVRCSAPGKIDLRR